MSADTTICAKDLSVVTAGTTILRNISAVFPSGKISVIMGPNGAGKSTLLSALSGLHVDGAKHVYIGDQSVSQLPIKHRARTIGLLPQTSNIVWDLTVTEFVGLGRMPYHRFFETVSDDSAHIAKAMAATDTAQFADRKILSLSGGERARVLLARVIAGTPEWLLADEPLANLDLRHQIDLLKLLRAEADKGVGVIAVLHDLYHAARFADQIILLRDGAILASGTPAEVLTAGNIQRAYDVDCQAVTLADNSTIFVPV